jgi:hypothetical protein
VLIWKELKGCIREKISGTNIILDGDLKPALLVEDTFLCV